MACWVPRYALPTSSWPADMLPSDTRTRIGPKRTPTADGGRRRKQTEADGIRKMEEKGIESVDFRHKFGPEPAAFPDIPPTSSSWAPDMLPSSTQTRCDPKRKLTEAGGSRRKQETGRNKPRIGLFSPQIWPRACWVPRYDPPTTSSWPPEMLPSETRTRSDPKRMPTEDGGS